MIGDDTYKLDKIFALKLLVYTLQYHLVFKNFYVSLIFLEPVSRVFGWGLVI